MPVKAKSRYIGAAEYSPSLSQSILLFCLQQDSKSSRHLQTQLFCLRPSLLVINQNQARIGFHGKSESFSFSSIDISMQHTEKLPVCY
jgi:hypothetical protein